ncbi:hypothetical protein HBDW_48440 [Herbaspirillum sp. DW155]|uniref:hypothetical protein n=1 Tax=Herbaspirillum sp. DW155 TaxID=3095609 RepID=UPI003093D12C|nr:hypothetical protein HBDW_48440 [Herbaspirillum sp. DW155]
MRFFRVVTSQALTREAFAACGELIASGRCERDINFGGALCLALPNQPRRILQ